jgi:multiple sugar transport system substrate-binding protein
MLKKCLMLAIVALLTLGTAFAQDTTLKFVSWMVDDPAFGPWWEGIIEEFEAAHPGVEIEFTKVARDVYVDTMITLFVGGEAPDIVHLASFEYPQFANEGWLEDLAPWVAQSDLDLEGWAGQDKCIWQGETNCIMLLYFGFIFAYNESMLEEAGVAVPTSYDEFIEAARTLTKDTDGDGIIDQFGTSHHTVSGNQYLTEMLNYVVDAGAYWTDENGVAAMNTPEMIEALSHWKTILTENLTPLDLSSGDTRQLFNEGRVAMKVDGPWLYGVMKRAEPEIFEQFRIVRPPFMTPVGGSSNVIGMPADISEERKELVWEFIELTSSQKWQEAFTLTGNPAPRPNAVSETVYEAVPHFDLLIETAQEASAAGVDRLPKGLEPVFNEFAKIVIENMQAMIINDLDPAEVAERLQQETLRLQSR